MTLDQIFKLLDAGYTKEEINELHDLQQSKEPEPKEPEPKEPEPKEPEPKEPEPKEPEPEPHYVDDIAKLTEQVKALTESMQEHFRNTAEGKKNGAIDGDNILKNILEKGEI